MWKHPTTIASPSGTTPLHLEHVVHQKLRKPPVKEERDRYEPYTAGWRYSPILLPRKPASTWNSFALSSYPHFERKSPSALKLHARIVYKTRNNKKTVDGKTRAVVTNPIRGDLPPSQFPLNSKECTTDSTFGDRTELLTSVTISARQ